MNKTPYSPGEYDGGIFKIITEDREHSEVAVPFTKMFNDLNYGDRVVVDGVVYVQSGGGFETDRETGNKKRILHLIPPSWHEKNVQAARAHIGRRNLRQRLKEPGKLSPMQTANPGFGQVYNIEDFL